MSVRRICVWGTSLRKLADEAQVIAFIQIVSRRFPGARITMFSQYGPLLTQRLGEERLRVTTIRTADLLRVVPALARCNLFVLEGGPFYEELSQALRCWLLVGIAKLFRRPVIAYAATAFHFKTWWGRALYRTLFNCMESVTVREPIGQEIIKALGIKREVELFADPRFVLEPVPLARVRAILVSEGIDPDRPLIGITTRYLHPGIPAWVKRSHGYTDADVERANDVMAKATVHLGGLAQLVLLPMHPTLEEDRATAAIIRSHLRDPSQLNVLSHRYGALEALGIIRHCELVFASRVGSAVFATVTGTPLVAVAYEPRMRDHMERIGLGAYVVDWNAMQADELIRMIDGVWMSRQRVKTELSASMARVRQLAWRNADVLERFLDGHAPQDVVTCASA